MADNIQEYAQIAKDTAVRLYKYPYNYLGGNRIVPA